MLHVNILNLVLPKYLCKEGNMMIKGIRKYNESLVRMSEILPDFDEREN